MTSIKRVQYLGSSSMSWRCGEIVLVEGCGSHLKCWRRPSTSNNDISSQWSHKRGHHSSAAGHPKVLRVALFFSHATLPSERAQALNWTIWFFHGIQRFEIVFMDSIFMHFHLCPPVPPRCKVTPCLPAGVVVGIAHQRVAWHNCGWLPAAVHVLPSNTCRTKGWPKHTLWIYTRLSPSHVRISYFVCTFVQWFNKR